MAVETADVVLVKNDPSDVSRSIQLARRVRGKIKQNLFWAAVYNFIAIPIAAGALYPALGVLLRPEWAAEGGKVEMDEKSAAPEPAGSKEKRATKPHSHGPGTKPHSH